MDGINVLLSIIFLLLIINHIIFSQETAKYYRQGNKTFNESEYKAHKESYLNDFKKIVPEATLREEFVNTTDVNGNPVTDQAKNILSTCYQFKTTSNTDFLSAIVKGGTLDGPVGVCNDNKYKFHHFVRTWGIVIILALFGLLIYMIFKNPSTTQNSSKSTTPVKK